MAAYNELFTFLRNRLHPYTGDLTSEWIVEVFVMSLHYRPIPPDFPLCMH